MKRFTCKNEGCCLMMLGQVVKMTCVDTELEATDSRGLDCWDGNYDSGNIYFVATILRFESRSMIHVKEVLVFDLRPRGVHLAWCWRQYQHFALT